MKTSSFLVAFVLCAVPAWAIPVAVTVVGPDDKPLAGAKLSVSEGAILDTSMADARGQCGQGGVFAWEWNGQFGPIDKDIRKAVETRGLLRVKATAPGMVPETRVLRAGQTTIHLQPARAWSGLLLDQNRQPIAGVTLKLERVQPPEATAGSELLESYLDPFLSVDDKIALTDEQGRWTLLGLPARGVAQFSVDEPRFVTQKFSVPINEGDAAPIILQQGARLTGVLLRPDGTPVAGQTLRAGFGPYGVTSTDEKGRFTFGGLEPGKITLYLVPPVAGAQQTDEVPAFVFDSQKPVAVEAGKTTDVGEIRGQKGVLVTARIVSADTKAPITDAILRVGLDSAGLTRVDANGQLQTRLTNSQISGSSLRAEVTSKDYVDYELPATAFDGAGETLDLGTIELKRGNVVSGTVSIEGGGDLSRLPTLTLERDGHNEFLRPDETGQFQSKILAPGSYQVKLVTTGKDWEITAPREVVVPAAGQVSAPVTILAKRLTPLVPLIKELRGQLLDPQGKALAGATVRARFKREGIGYFSVETALSDAQGNFQLKADRGDSVAVEWAGAAHPDYLIGGDAKIEVRDGIALVSGLTTKARGAIFAGRVTDAQGKPLDKAWVAVVEARDTEPVQTGADGTFALPDVPLEKFTLIAAKGRAWTEQAAQSDQSGALLKLPAAPAAANVDELQSRIVAIKSGVSWADLTENWDALGAPLIERFLWRNGTPNAQVMATYGAQLARRDPAQLLRRAPEFLAATQGDGREDVLAQINLLRAQSGDADARAAANAWLDEQKQIKREINARSVTQLLQMAAVASALKRADAAQWLDYAAGVAAQLGDKMESQDRAWSAPLAALGAAATARFAENWGAPAEFILWAGVGSEMAQNGDTPGARRALERLQSLSRQPELADLDNWQTSPRRVDEVRRELARALAPTDDGAALQTALQIKGEPERARALLEVAQSAQKSSHVAVAERALREVGNLRGYGDENLAQAAAIGAQIRPDLGDELFAAARRVALPDASERSGFSSPSIGKWAQYHAPFDAAQSRVLIEREWNWRLPAAIQNKDDLLSRNESYLAELVRAMSAIDIGRATEMQAAVDAAQIKSYGSKTSPFDLTIVALATAQ